MAGHIRALQQGPGFSQGLFVDVAEPELAAFVIEVQGQRPANARVLEVLVDVESGSPLLPGMEVDVLFLSNEKTTADNATN